MNEVFNERVLSEFGQGRIAVGHVRYSTTGNVNTANCQPMTVRHVKGALAIAHNGNLINALELRRQYELKGAIFHSTSILRSYPTQLPRRGLRPAPFRKRSRKLCTK